MNCNIIKDLLPSYIDKISSEETAAAVEKHTERCADCKQYLHMMQQPTIPIVEMDVEVAKKPFKRINKVRRLQVIIAILMTFMITIIAALVIQEVGVVSQYVSPKVTGIVNITDEREEWKSVSFSHDGIHHQDYVRYDRIFWIKRVINDANSEGNVWLRVKDEEGNIRIDAFQLSPGKGVDLKELKRNEKYFFEIKAPVGRHFINAV